LQLELAQNTPPTRLPHPEQLNACAALCITAKEASKADVKHLELDTENGPTTDGRVPVTAEMAAAKLTQGRAHAIVD